MQKRLRRHQSFTACLLLCALLAPAAQAAKRYPNQQFELEEVFIRARVTRMQPEAPVGIRWRWGGEGQGGGVISGSLTELPVQAPTDVTDAADAAFDELSGDADLAELDEDFATFGEEKDTTRVIVETELHDHEYLKVGTWSQWLPLTTFKAWKQRVFTITLQPLTRKSGLVKDDEWARKLEDGFMVRSEEIRDVVMEFELKYGDDVFKRFSEAGPDGATIGLAIDMRRMLKSGLPPTDPECHRWADGLSGFVENRRQYLAKQFAAYPWSTYPQSKKFAFIADCRGYGVGVDYGVRHTNMKVIENEFRMLELMGINGLRGVPAFVPPKVVKGEGIYKRFQRAAIGFVRQQTPVCRDWNENGLLDDPGEFPPGAGCPYHPAAKEFTRERTAAFLEGVTNVKDSPIQEIWALTDDEIGQVHAYAPEGKAHRHSCPHCAEAFREFVKSEGVTSPAQFGRASWDEVSSWAGPLDERPLPWPEQLAIILAAQKAERDALIAELQERLDDIELRDGDEAVEAMMDEVATGLDRDDEPDEDAAPGATGAGADDAPEEEDLDAAVRREETDAPPAVAEPEPPSETTPDGRTLAQSNENSYYGYRFQSVATGMAYDHLRRAFAEFNAESERLEQAGQGRRPRLYSYALQGQIYPSGHSLGWYDFYMHGDNALMYETSKSGVRNSFICEGARVICEEFGQKQSILIKPKRGTPLQSALALISRGGTLVYWYTYGPEYGDAPNSFGRLDSAIRRVSSFAHYMGRAEHILWGARYERDPEVAIVLARTSKINRSKTPGGNKGNSGIYYPLLHGQYGVDPINEWMVTHRDLSRYKVIYVSGAHLRRDAAARLAEWVKAGGILYTFYYGCVADEASQPLTSLYEVFGVEKRNEWQPWKTSRRWAKDPETGRKYRHYEQIGAPDGARTVAANGLPAVMPWGGREVLAPTKGTEVLLRYEDGGAALVRNRYGQGMAYLVGFDTAAVYSRAGSTANVERLVTLPVEESVTRPLIADQTIEAHLMLNPETGKRAINLVNWPGVDTAPDTFVRDLVLRLPGAAERIAQDEVFAVAAGKRLPVTRKGADLEIAVPSVKEVEILLFE